MLHMLKVSHTLTAEGQNKLLIVRLFSADLSELVIVMLDTLKWICYTVSKRYISAYVGENECVCVCVYKNN